MARSQLEPGDMALEIEPMGPRGGAHPAPDERLYTVESAIGMFAEGLGPATGTVLHYRWTASRWPAEQRRSGTAQPNSPGQPVWNSAQGRKIRADTEGYAGCNRSCLCRVDPTDLPMW